MNTNKSTYLKWIDIAKALTLFLVIIGHCMDLSHYSNIVRGFIFTFHMPLFFLLSGKTSHFSTNMNEFKEKTIRSFFQLIVPAIIIYGIFVLIQLIDHPTLAISLSFWREKVYTFLFASGVETYVNDVYVAPIGILWFLFVLFETRTVYDYLQMNYPKGQLLVVICILCILGVVVGEHFWLPFSFDISLAILPFFYVGDRFDKIFNNDKSWKKFFTYLILGCVILYTYFYSTDGKRYLELSMRNYYFFPISYITGTLLTLALCQFSVNIQNLWFTDSLAYLGKKTIYLLYIHIFDDYYSFLWYREGNILLTTLLRLAIDLILFVIVLLIKEKLDEKKKTDKVLLS